MKVKNPLNINLVSVNYNLQPDTSEPLPKVCRAFLEAIQTNTSPITDGQYGLDIIKVIEAAQISIRKKGEPPRSNSNLSNSKICYYLLLKFLSY